MLGCFGESHCFEKDPPTLNFLTANCVVEISDYGHLNHFKLYVIAFIPGVHALFFFAHLKILKLCVFSRLANIHHQTLSRLSSCPRSC